LFPTSSKGHLDNKTLASDKGQNAIDTQPHLAGLDYAKRLVVGIKYVLDFFSMAE
jgi:hypothetical protein